MESQAVVAPPERARVPMAGEQASLHALVNMLRESEERFRTMADCAPVLLWMAEPDAKCSFFNKVWLDFTGRALEEEIGDGWAESVYFEDFQRCMDTYLSSFVQRKPFRMEYRMRRADGEYRWLLDTGVPRFTPDGQFAGYIGSCIDITELKEAHDALHRINEDLERRVEQRTAELKQSNEELEQFAYAASHDLQAPLRAISGYTSLIQKRYGDQLEGDAMEFFGYIAKGTQHMHALIQDLLAYSRAGRRDRSVAPVALDDMVDRVLEDLDPLVKESGAVIERAPLPTVEGEATLLGQVFQNLIANALKFRGSRAPEIRIGSKRHKDGWEISVSDNGIGIAPEHRDRIFGIFQRLHTSDEYPGTGIGLALCKRVVERHGGRIGLDSVPGEGTTFRFTLPAAKPAEKH